MTAHCATCRHFGESAPVIDGDYNDADEWVERTSTHHHCTRIVHDGSRFDAVANEPALTDSSGCIYRLRVLPTFGCVLHEPR